MGGGIEPPVARAFPAPALRRFGGLDVPLGRGLRQARRGGRAGRADGAHLFGGAGKSRSGRHGMSFPGQGGSLPIPVSLARRAKRQTDRDRPCASMPPCRRHRPCAAPWGGPGPDGRAGASAPLRPHQPGAAGRCLVVFTAEETLSVTACAYSWRARLGPAHAVVMHDSPDAGRPGQCSVRAFGRLPLPFAPRPQALPRSERLRYLTELPLAPDAMLHNRSLRREEIDESQQPPTAVRSAPARAPTAAGTIRSGFTMRFPFTSGTSAIGTGAQAGSGQQAPLKGCGGVRLLRSHAPPHDSPAPGRGS